MLNGRAVRAGTTGAPVFDEAIAWMDCEVRHSLDLGTHTLFVGEVVDRGDRRRRGPPGVDDRHEHEVRRRQPPLTRPARGYSTPSVCMTQAITLPSPLRMSVCTTMMCDGRREERLGGGDDTTRGHSPEEVGLRLDGRGTGGALGQVEERADRAEAVGQRHQCSAMQRATDGASVVSYPLHPPTTRSADASSSSTPTATTGTAATQQHVSIHRGTIAAGTVATTESVAATPRRTLQGERWPSPPR